MGDSFDLTAEIGGPNLSSVDVTSAFDGRGGPVCKDNADHHRRLSSSWAMSVEVILLRSAFNREQDHSCKPANNQDNVSDLIDVTAKEEIWRRAGADVLSSFTRPTSSIRKTLTQHPIRTKAPKHQAKCKLGDSIVSQVTRRGLVRGT